MVKAIEEHGTDLRELCRRFGVKCLDVFGSAAMDERFDPARSDIDFLVEFDLSDPVRHARAYFGLLAALKDLFSRDVDLVEIRAISNPYFLQSISQGRQQVYAA
jgi:predicted nucleotidyltransferase